MGDTIVTEFYRPAHTPLGLACTVMIYFKK